MSLHDQPFGVLLESIAEKTPAPGGGAVASMTGATAAALAQMVVGYSFTKKLAPHHDELTEVARKLGNTRRLFLTIADEDANAYQLVSELSRLPEDDPRRQAELDAAVIAATNFPLSAMAAACDLLRTLDGLHAFTNPNLRSDLAIAATLAGATVRCAECNVRINLPTIEKPELRSRISADADRLRQTGTALAQAIERACAT